MPKFLSRHARPFLPLVLTLLLAGCLRRGDDNMTFGLEEFLPADWTPVGDVIEVDIDGDEDVERLLFYHYDRSSESAGPVGALIFDLRQGETTVTSEGEPLARQSSSSLVRHQILPSYWQGAGQGFIAAPDQAGNIPVYTVTYPGADIAGVGSARKELVVLGGNSYLTFIWWRGRMDGYGVTQIYAPGGFEGVDWTAYTRRPEPITQVIGLYPQHDRSLTCRKVGYDRVDTEPANLALDDATVTYRQTIAYRASNHGLDFCYGIPTSPFYPEAVVLAYLLDPPNQLLLLDSTLQADPEAARLRGIIDPAQLILVDDLRSPVDVPFFAARSACLCQSD